MSITGKGFAANPERFGVRVVSNLLETGMDPAATDRAPRIRGGGSERR